jgi:Holliday junction resolvase RusA-like endonuclease
MVPPSPNELRRKYRHVHAYKDLRNEWERCIWYLIERRDKKLLLDAALTYRMRVRITIFHTGRYDPDNLRGSQKPVLDALKNLGFIHDDSEKWIQLEEPVQILVSAVDEHTVIEIEPLWDRDKAA